MTVYTPNLPALLTALPGDATRAPQTEFDRARQVLFLENLSVTGSVRSAAAGGRGRGWLPAAQRFGVNFVSTSAVFRGSRGTASAPAR